MGKYHHKRVLDDALAAAVLPLRARRTLVFEKYTHEDWEDVRSRLPEEYRHLSDERLRDLAVKLRKRGRFESQEKKMRAVLWTEVKKVVRSFWSGNCSLGELGDQLNMLKSDGIH
jgi:hypothetical protein